MTNLRKLAIAVAVVGGILALVFVIGRFDRNQPDLLRVFRAYKEKGKSTQFSVDDIRKGFN